MSYHKTQTVDMRIYQLPSYFILSLILTFGGWLVPSETNANNLPVFQYKHTSPGGFIANQPTSVNLHLHSEENISNVRLYFRTFSLKDYLFIELRADGQGNYSGNLPAFDDSVTSLEYLFLWQNGTRKIIRTRPQLLMQAGSAAKSQIVKTPHRIYTEIEDTDAGALGGILSDPFTLDPVSGKLHLGMRAGLFDMSGDKRYRYGYFGGFLYEADKDITYAIEGYVNFAPTSDSRSDSRGLDQPSLSQTPQGYPNVAGDDWSGVYYRTDSSRRTNITAVITHNGYGDVTVTTSLSGRGHYLTGTISSGYSGDLYLIDEYDDEIWTTHDLEESTSVYFGFEDYVYRPSSSDPDPPLYRIELTRPEPKTPGEWLPPILDLLLLN